VPDQVQPVAGEYIHHKCSYSAFVDESLAAHLRQERVGRVVLAGVHLRACVRATAVDAYQRQFEVWFAEDALGDDDPLHGAVSRRYLADRVGRFLPVDDILCAVECEACKKPEADDDRYSSRLPALVAGGQMVDGSGLEAAAHVSPCAPARPLWEVPLCRTEQVALATKAARRAVIEMNNCSQSQRSAWIGGLVGRLEAAAEALARQIAVETGKPIGDARLELAFALELVKSATRAASAASSPEEGRGWKLVRRPLGVVAVVTPWNNPVAIPLGKIVPALLYGNALVWKPALPGAGLAAALHRLLVEAGLPPGAVTLIQGDRTTAEQLIDHPHVDGATLTGSSAAGYSAQAICARRRIPFQGELGGNNAAIVWTDTDLGDAAKQIARAGFGSAGQRCTANRRVVVAADVHRDFLDALCAATREMPWGDSLNEATRIGPVISKAAHHSTRQAVERAGAEGAEVIVPHGPGATHTDLLECGWYYPATLVLCDDPAAEIVQEETFGPVVVVLRAGDWRQALALCNGVRQGLVASLFSNSGARQEEFLNEARAGILKINAATAGAAGDAPFGGWKDSGVGPPEHGTADLEFYTRRQTVYRPES
jgi:acyl-CoA reductase-like NAD-dependent aldehyde dehydrogenase